MGLADGDLYVSGSILSFQQMKRIYQNFRAASVPSNLQAGALWSDSDDDRLWHQGASDLLEVFTEKTTLTWENLLSNSGFGVWSQSDAAKGVATMAYDTGAKGAGTTPSVGDAAVGGTSGATAKVISYTIATGTWDAGNATGVFTLGACTGRFEDNETVTFGGVETAVVNQPDSVAGVDFVRNGELNSWDGAGDPNNFPDGFTLVNQSANNYFHDNGDGTGNLVSNNTSAVRIEQETDDDLTEGKIYKFSITITNWVSGEVRMSLGGAFVRPTGGMGWAANGTFEFVFEATATDVFTFRLYRDNAGNTDYDFGKISVYEITPCCTAADTKAMDLWIKDSTADIYREHSGGNVKDGSFYANKLVVTATADYVRFPGAVFDNEEWYMQLQGRTVTFGKWVKTSTASHAKLTITDSAGSTSSSYHTGGGTYEWLKVTRSINASATSVAFYVYGDIAPNVNGNTIIYHCQGMLVFGAYIGEGNYQPKPQEFIWLEKNIPSNVYDGLTSQSDLAYADLNIEADSDAMLPKGVKKIAVHTEIDDSGSGAGLDVHLELRKDATAGTFFCNSVAGKPNDIHSHAMGLQPCDVNGDIDIHLDASGASTLDIDEFEYHGVQVN